MSLFNKFKLLVTSKEQKFLYIDAENFFKYRYLIYFLLLFNKNYKRCQIFRKSYKNHKEIVVVALRWYGKNVKRRTNGIAKSKVASGEAKTCICCDVSLTDENATVEHIQGIGRGGNNAQVNLIITCKDCNSERGDQDFYEYLRTKNPKYKKIKYPFI